MSTYPFRLKVNELRIVGLCDANRCDATQTITHLKVELCNRHWQELCDGRDDRIDEVLRDIKGVGSGVNTMFQAEAVRGVELWPSKNLILLATSKMRAS